MKKVMSVEVNSHRKMRRILDAMNRAGRLAIYDEFFTFTGSFYVIWYRAV